MIRLIDPVFPDAKDLLEDYNLILDSGMYSNGGPFCQQFERDLSEFVGSEYGVAVCNGTMALNIAMKGLGIENMRVAVPNFTFCATVQSILENNCTPVMIDVDRRTMTMDTSDLRAKIDEVDAVIAVDSFGNPCDYEYIQSIAKDKPVIFDSAGSIASKYHDKPIGEFGVHCYSLHATKLLPVGEGGFISTNDEELAKKMDSLINFGMISGKVVYENGTNGKLDELRCAMGIRGLKGLSGAAEYRRILADVYVKLLDGVCEFQKEFRDCRNCHQLFPLVFDDQKARDKVRMYLNENNVICKPYYDKFYDEVNLINTDYLVDRILCVPLHSNLLIGEVETICNYIKEVV